MKKIYITPTARIHELKVQATLNSISGLGAKTIEQEEQISGIEYEEEEIEGD